MAAVTVHSDFGAQENKICYCFHYSVYLPILKIRLFVFLVLSCMSSLYSLDIYSLSIISFANIFSQVGCLFGFFWWFLCCAKLLHLTRFICLFSLSRQRNLTGYSPQGHTESDTTKATKHAYMPPKNITMIYYDNKILLWFKGGSAYILF